MRRFLMLILIMTTISSCSYTAYYVENKSYLSDVNSSCNPNIAKVHNDSWSDEFITIELQKTTLEEIELQIHNNHKSTIRILCNEAALVDTTGLSHDLSHDGKLSVKVASSTSARASSGSVQTSSEVAIDLEKAQNTRIIPANSFANISFKPVDGAQIRPTFKSKDYDNFEAAQSIAQEWNVNDSAIRLLLPIEIDNRKIEYTMTLSNEFIVTSTEKVDGVIEILGLLCLGLISLAIL